jgi:hypothetical protein
MQPALYDLSNSPTLSAEADSHSVDQGITRLLLWHKGSLPCPQQPTIGLFGELDESSAQTLLPYYPS